MGKCNRRPWGSVIVAHHYGWRFSDEEALKKRVQTAGSPMDHNRIYWLDQAHNVEAYAAMTFWRGTELLRPAIRSLNVHEVVAPAVLARSFLELAAAFLVNANVVERTLTELRFTENAVVVSYDSEERVVKMVLGNPPRRAGSSREADECSDGDSEALSKSKRRWHAKQSTALLPKAQHSAARNKSWKVSVNAKVEADA